MPQSRIAAVVYEPGEGETTDRLLWALAERLRADGVALAGTTQRSAERPDRCRCDMIVAELGSGDETRISEDRGAEARGCRLDTAALEHLAGATIQTIERGADMLIVNKFGKREAEGAGMRPAIAEAFAADIPVLVAVNRAGIDAWRSFTGGLSEELRPDAGAIRSWIEAQRLPARV